MTARALVVGAAVFALGVLVAVSGLAAASQPAAPTPGRTPTPLTGEEEHGRLLYFRDCAWCHGDEGRGTARGPSIAASGAASTDFMLRTGRMPIDAPETQPERGDPAYSDAEIEALVAYVATLGAGPDIPEVDPRAGILPQGLLLYQRHCAACHSSTGVGAALTSGLIAPPLLDSTPREIAEAMRLGGAGLRSGNMPRFDENVIDDDELNSIVAYILTLQRLEARGGNRLQGFGPVAEGLAAFAIALVLSLLLARWIGERARDGR